MICAQREEPGNQDVTQRLSGVSLVSPAPVPVFLGGLGSGHVSSTHSPNVIHAWRGICGEPQHSRMWMMDLMQDPALGTRMFS